MRTLEAIDADIARLGRPVHPSSRGGAGDRPSRRLAGMELLERAALAPDAKVTHSWPKAIGAWRESRDAWRVANPEGEERYALLLEEREEVELAMVRRRAAADNARQLAIPPHTRDALAAMRALPVTESAAAWVAGTKQWLVLAGAVGAGKSVAAAHALTLAAARGASGIWVSSAGLAVMVGGFGAVAECERLKHLDVMVLDDFGTEHLSSFAASVFHEVLAARHENGVRTIMTHNLRPDVFRARLGSRLADRVRSACVYVECSGASLRRAAP
jgi:DNA replication protein DnaC